MFYNRKHIRLREFDYASGNAYFITICVQDFECVFGVIRGGIMGLSPIGNSAAIYLQLIPEIRAGVVLGEFILMPNHLHCILELPPKQNKEWSPNQYAHPLQNSISVIINQYKGAVTKWCKENGYPNFKWQSRFYDHIIRDNQSYANITDYIAHNPTSWHKDRLFRRDLPLANPLNETSLYK